MPETNSSLTPQSLYLFHAQLLWWGMWILCLSPAVDGSNSQRAHDAQYGAIFSPLLTMALLLFLSGIPLAEKPSQKKYFLMSHGSDGGQSLTPTKSQPEEDPWTRMKAYRERTSILLPLPPVVYKHLPRFIKSTVLFDVSVPVFVTVLCHPMGIQMLTASGSFCVTSITVPVLQL